MLYRMKVDVSILFERPMKAKEACNVIKSIGLHDSFVARECAVKRYSFAIPCVEAVEALVKLSPLVEVGAGSGYWSKIVREAGADIVATDIGKQSGYSKLWNIVDVLQMSALDAVKAYPDRNVFVCWPSYNEGWAAKMAKKIKPGRSLVYIGEGRGGATADSDFFKVLDKYFNEVEQMSIPQWDGLHDFMSIFKRK